VGELGCVSAVFLNALAISNNFLFQRSAGVSPARFLFSPY